MIDFDKTTIKLSNVQHKRYSIEFGDAPKESGVCYDFFEIVPDSEGCFVYNNKVQISFDRQNSIIVIGTYIENDVVFQHDDNIHFCVLDGTNILTAILIKIDVIKRAE